MQLLPIIVVVSLLAFFVSVTVVICAYRSFRAQEKGRGKQNLRNREEPVRQLTLRNGRVIAITDEFKDLTTIQTGDSAVSGKGPVGSAPRSPKYKLFGLRDSRPPTDLEAQNQSQNRDPRKWEEDMRNLQKFNKELVESGHFLNSQPLGSRTSRPTNRQRDISSKRITESLKKAYDVPIVRSRDMSEVPLSPKSKPTTARRSSRRRVSSTRLGLSPNRRISKAKSEGNQSREAPGREDSMAKLEGSERKASGKSASLPPLPIKSVAAAKVPDPVESVEIRSSKGRISSTQGQNAKAASSLSTTKTTNSRAASYTSKRTSDQSQKSHRHSQKSRASSQALPPLPTTKSPAPPVPPPPSQIFTSQALSSKPSKVPRPPSKTTKTPRSSAQTLKPAPSTSEPARTSIVSAEKPELPKPIKVSPINIRFIEESKPEIPPIRQHRPPDIDIKVANKKHRSSFLLDSNTPPTSPLKTPEAAVQQDISTRSSHSIQTFNSSDISSAWTIGNAQRVAIFPSVAPRALAVGSTNIAPLRPRSKYGRPIGKRGQKALPVLPKSPLGQEQEEENA
ncbi:MAG: hypothetical protein LQ342_001865 [Letrouitia transgressa]|nr:MAG: hypothetical protein LQ342_001865 [Letrouitia transgressa]